MEVMNRSGSLLFFGSKCQLSNESKDEEADS